MAKKVPKGATPTVDRGKQTALSRRVVDPGASASDCHPLWCFKTLDHNDGGEYGWHRADSSAKSAIFDFLHSVGGNTWGELRGQQWGNPGKRHRKHHELPIHALPAAAQDRLRALEKDDYDALFRFRLSNLERLWGIVTDEVFYVIWWDPDHKVFPTEKS